MNFLSLCSGIEAASVAFEPLGWTAVGFAEINPFASAVLAHRYPEVPNFGDITRFREWPEEAFAEADIVVGGPPCRAPAGSASGLIVRLAGRNSKSRPRDRLRRAISQP